jgi:hypothetical protein
MSNTEIVAIIVVIALILLVVGNVVFSVLTERNNPPIGTFTECDGVRLHYLERGSRGSVRSAAPWQRLDDPRLYDQRAC